MPTGSSTLLYPLDEVGIELTYRCNYSCRYCYNPVDILPFLPEISTDHVKSIVAQAGELEVRKIGFIGGEPTLRKDLVDLIRYARHTTSAGLCLTTNGSLLPPERLHQLHTAGLDVTQISIHLEDVNLGRAFDRTKLVEVAESYVRTINSAKKSGLGVKVHLVFFKQYLPYVVELVKRMLEESQADLVSLGPLFIAGHARGEPQNMMPTQSEVESIYNDLMQLRRAHGKRFGLFPKQVYYEAGRQSVYTNPQKSDYRYFGSYVSVAPNGDVMASDGATDPLTIDAAKIGNIKEESLRKIIERLQSRIVSYTTSREVQSKFRDLTLR